ncbi:MAG: alpha/beta fold hydrolase [Kribbellaceae bacterium]
MPTFLAPDGTELAFHLTGTGAPVICLPGGMQASAYLGDLGGLDAHRQLVLLDLRGTGESGLPADPASYRCDRQVGDVEALREHLGLDRMDLLAHSGGANLAVRYVAAYPHRIGRLSLVTPSTRAVGIEVTAETRARLLALRKDEPWYPAAATAFETIAAGRGQQADWAAVAPMAYGRWDAEAQAHQAAEAGQRNDEAFGIFNADGAFDPAAIRAGLAGVRAPVLLLAGELDWTTDPGAAAEFAGLFPNARLVVQPGAGHFPWLHDPAEFVTSVAAFLA